jgi:hypothetical protein
MDFVHYGMPVNITAPPAGDIATIQNFLQAAESHATSTTDPPHCGGGDPLDVRSAAYCRLSWPGVSASPGSGFMSSKAANLRRSSPLSDASSTNSA